MSIEALFTQLQQWQQAGHLRALDVALARFIHDTDPQAPASLLLAAAAVAQLESQGHSGLPLNEPLHDLLPALAADGAPAWPSGEAACVQAWQGLASVQIEPTDDTGHSPLVLSGGLLHLRRYWRHETQVAAQVLGRVAAEADAPDPTRVRAVLDALFAPAPPNWQKIACALALRGRLTLITGGPGTGKTYTAARLLVLMQALHEAPQPLRVAMAAPTGKAAARLQQSILKALQGLDPALALQLGVPRWMPDLPPARTLHALLGSQAGTRRFRHHAGHPLDVDLLFVDEASMVHLEMMAQLLDALPPQARVVLLGDKDQLASVEAGSVMADLCAQGEGSRYAPDTAQWLALTTGHALPTEHQGPGTRLAQQTAVLRHSHRFGGPIGLLAQAVNRGDGAQCMALLQDQAENGPETSRSEIRLVHARDASGVARLALDATVGWRGYLERLAQRPRFAGAPAAASSSDFAEWARELLRRFDDFRVLCAVREGPWGVTGLNAAIEQSLTAAGLLKVRGEWYEGRPVMVTRNSPDLGVFNGDIGLVLRGPAPQDGLRCWFLDGQHLRSVSVSRLSEVETAYAMTVHKSQGSEFAHVALVLPDADVPVLTRELLYTGITRARSVLSVVAKNPALLTTAVGRLTRRVSGLRARLSSA